MAQLLVSGYLILTDDCTAWERITNVAESMVEDHRKRRLREEHRQLLKPRFAKLDEAILTHLVPFPRTAQSEFNRPLFLDLVLMDECRALIDVPATEEIAPHRYDEAVAPMERAILTMSQDPLVNDHLGDIYWKVGRQREAEIQWQRALSLDPTETDDVDPDRIRAKLERGLDAVLSEEAAARVDAPAPAPQAANN